MNQEILLGGHVYLGLLKEKLQDWLETLRSLMLKVRKEKRRKERKKRKMGEDGKESCSITFCHHA
tara:strand:- start:630 stop:824 length:195 start_codon:yes stop_codon:yes gene_type:complete